MRASTKNEWSPSPDSILYKAFTLKEFESGILLTTTISEQYKTFAINFSRQLQQEYNCQTASEKATCEIVALSFTRILEIQRKLNNVLSIGSTNQNINQHIAILSKELDRANRHYLSTIQTLRMMKQAPVQITVKARTAVIGQNQVIQANSHE